MNPQDRARLLALLEVYRYIERKNKEEWTSPTVAEIAARFPSPSQGVARSSAVINYWLDRMEELKMIEPRPRFRARSLRVKPLDKRNKRIKAMLEAEKNGK